MAWLEFPASRDGTLVRHPPDDRPSEAEYSANWRPLQDLALANGGGKAPMPGSYPQSMKAFDTIIIDDLRHLTKHSEKSYKQAKDRLATSSSSHPPAPLQNEVGGR
jgi:hypothetical protein